MNRFLKLIVIPFVIALLIFLFIRFVWLRGFEFSDMSVEEYVKFYNSNNEGIVYVTKDDAVKKNEFEEVIGSNFEAKEIKVYELNLTKASDDDKQKFIDANEFTDDEFIIPMLLYIKDGAIVDSIEGYAPDYVVADFITSNDIK